MSSTAIKEQAHTLIDRMSPGQLSVLVNVLEDLLDPLTAKLANSPVDDGPTTDFDRDVIARSRTSETIATPYFLEAFGLTTEDFYKLADELPASTAR